MKKKQKVDLVIDKLVRNKNFIKHINSIKKKFKTNIWKKNL